jgi:hypothetical protein
MSDLSDASFFIAGGVSRDDNERNEIPAGYARRGLYWDLVGPMLGLPGEKYPPVDRQGVSPEIQQIRDYERRRLGPTIGDLAQEAVTHAVDAVREVVAKVRRPSELAKAKKFLGETLSSEPMLATTVQKLAAEAGISARTLRRAAKAMKVRIRKKSGHGPWFWSMVRGGHDAQAAG